jgi:hypothetical protein
MRHLKRGIPQFGKLPAPTPAVRWAIVAILTLAGANFLAFYPHFLGRMTFPFDFIGGYHAQAFAWYADGDFFHPPKWFSWGDLGFPAYWSLQSGAFYIPLALLDLINQPYTIQAATILQILHVLAGGVGMYVLLRALDFDQPLALLGALAFHFSSSFYSNAQHVDIIRATAFLPWLMWCLHPNIILRSWAQPIIAALLLFQFIVAAYPGSIVASAYTLALFVGAFSIPYIRRGDTLRLTLIYALVGLSALAMAMLKWLPPLVEGDWVSTDGALRMPLTPSLLITLLLSHNKPFLPNDPTMRSLWLPTGFTIGCIFISQLSYVTKVFLILIAAALLAAMSPALFGQSLPLPGFSVSRFSLSDWRPTLHIGLIVLACDGWRTVTNELDSKSVSHRTLLAMMSFALLAWVAIQLGYSLADLLLPAATIITAAALVSAGAVAARFRRWDISTISVALIVGVGIIVLGEADIFHKREGRSWRLEWGAKIERQMFDFRLSSVSRTDRGPLSTTRRPARFVIGESYDAVVKRQNSVAYNRCFYAPLFCVLGYNNLRLSLPHLSYRQAISDPVSGPKLLNFVRQAQTLFVIPAGTPFNLLMIGSRSDPEEIETVVPGISGSIVGYGGSWARYKLSTTTAVRVVENEIWTRGWSFRLCRNNQCLAPQSTEHTSEYLRTWIVPPGDWDIEVYFEVHSERYAWMLFYAGVLLLLAAGLLGYLLSRRLAGS